MIRRLGWLSAVVLSLGAVARANDAADKPAAMAVDKPAGKPAAVAVEARIRLNDAAVQRAMQDELARSMSDLHLGDESRPYYLGYTIYDLEQASVNATLGALTASHAYRGRILRTDLRVGDPSFDNSNFEGGARVETVPIEDDYAALRRELWLRTDEAYKAALETLARKRAAAEGQAAAAADEAAVGDFSKEAPAHLEVPFPAGAAEPEALRESARKLSSVLADFPEISSSRVSASYAIVRRRLLSSEGTFVDDNQHTVQINVVAETQAPDGMKLRSFVPFTALTPAGLPRARRDGEVGPRDGQGAGGDAERAGRRLGRRRRAVRRAGGAPGREAPARRSGRRHAAPQDRAGGERRGERSRGAGHQAGAEGRRGGRKRGGRSGAGVGPGKAPLYGGYKIDDEGVPAQRVSLIEHGVLKSLLMSRTPRKEIVHSNGHARAPRFAAPRARVGTLVVSGVHPQPRAALLDELGKIAKGGGVTTYVVRLLDDDSLAGGEADDLAALLSFGMGGHGPPPVRPLVVYRLDHGKETLVRGLLLENLLPRSLKDITAVGADADRLQFPGRGRRFLRRADDHHLATAAGLRR